METLRVFGAGAVADERLADPAGRRDAAAAHGAALSPTRWRVAEFLRGHRGSRWVNYPGLAEHPQHAWSHRQMRAVGGRPGASGCSPSASRAACAAGGERSSRRRSFMSHLANIGDTKHADHPSGLDHPPPARRGAAARAPACSPTWCGSRSASSTSTTSSGTSTRRSKPPAAERAARNMADAQPGTAHEHLRAGPRQDRGQPRAAVAGELRRAQRRGLRRPRVGGPRRAGATRWKRHARPRSPAWQRRWRALGVGRGTTVSAMLHNTPGDGRGALRRAGPQRGAQHPQHPARRVAARLADEPLRDRGADHRPRALADDGRGAAPAARRPRPHAGGDRRLRQRVRRPGRAPRRARVRGAARSAPAAGRARRARATSGTRSPSPTPRARPATRRAWSRTTAAPT